MIRIIKKGGPKLSFSAPKHYCYVFSILTIIAGCSKQNSTTRPPEFTPLTLTVNERTTNKPIAGAKVSVLKCSNYDYVFGCTAYSPYRTLTTNAEGKAAFTGNSNSDHIEVEAANYWRLYKKTDILNVVLTPKTSIQVNIKREKTYSPTDILWIGQDRHLFDLRPIGLPADTVIYIDGYGYSDNKIYWYINYANSGVVNMGSTGGSSPTFYINGFDSTRIEIKY